MTRLTPVPFTFFALALLASPAQAQWSVAVHGGANFGDLIIDADTGDEEVDRRTGILAGVIFSYQARENLRLRAGGLFSQKGGTQHQAGGYEAGVRLSYAEFPFTVQLFPFGEGRIKPFLTGGTYVAFETDCGLHVVGGGQTISMSCETEAADRKKSDLGVLLGGGAEVDLGPVDLALEAGYSIGFQDISHTTTAEVRARAISLSVGLRYAFQGG